ncbi:BIG/ATPase V1 complex, subunit S1 [Coniella lustricola]|uniref:Protein BIG1 n=1 Tax=Coniella lustricola TaxID=2025994 RepID=A0A2T3AL06_9PEZI|nr:BIG/ATPase V1 complex, subunit S1 [Coniella lustricola]
MRYSIAAGLLATSGAAAFSDSSPFLMYSTSSKFSPPAAPPQLQSTASVLATAQSLLSSCPTSLYLIYTHPNVHASDVRNPNTGACNEHNLCAPRRYNNATKDWESITAVYGVSEVVGPEISAGELQSYIEDVCAKEGQQGATVVLTHLDPLPPSSTENDDRSWAMTFESRLIAQMVDNRKQLLVNGGDDDEYTVIYFAGAHVPQYQAEFNDAAGAGAEVQMELRKRAWEVRADADKGAGKPASSAPLFVKYQFFTPGIFMGFLGAIIMISMLYVGLSAVASLQVSYGAFDKEMGPAAQKKNS